ncbi:two component transcriptional regulator, winged helix family [Hymenobacter roseosalivarius DSM 11622]|uniref:Two component transcriptional regulator, winged helix family n=1 Tax=Hymenobacter roseosalivarius DSM 11622 TaxID=645990 RepID=A0A1W1VCL4_9BACT|nr:response regulator transcription factor [Hymenobacter roseosalivarius]SMB91065.1 two component transcriptional regulator, winged helix family [Hymenobacter roseosalivarius DSM 11622]
MSLPHLLLLEDELPLARLLRESLSRSGYQVTHVTDGQQGLAAFHQTPFTLCIVDVMLPVLDGFAFVRELRRTDPLTPVLFLTAKSLPADVVRGFTVGGNDYLKKPFGLDELLLRIRELLRRTAPPEPAEMLPSVPVGRYTFLPFKQELWFAGQLTAKLSHRESELLRLLVQHQGRILDRSRCLHQLWGNDNFFTARSMDVFISKLRKHLRHDPAVEILNIRGLGYKLIV